MIVVLFLISSAQQLTAQIKAAAESTLWTVYNREVTFLRDTIYLSTADRDGILWLNNTDFKSGVIELDIKGKDVRGESFVGVAFHGQDDRTFDGIYFRPFNFRSPDRKTHSVQYISMPENDWRYLRENFPGKYEKEVTPVPDPENWFHAKIVIDGLSVKVFVDGSDTPSLEVEKISKNIQGKVGLWVGDGSDGYFKNFTLSPR